MASKNKILLFSFLIFQFIGFDLQASATSNEFIPCQKIALKVLGHCLDKKAGHNNNLECWDDSRKYFLSCKTSVMNRHNRKKIKKKREAFLIKKKKLLDSQ